MRSVRFVLASLFLAALSILPLSASSAKAPSIIVNGDPPLSFTIVTTNSFGFGADPLGGGDFGFTNDTGQTWTRLDIFVTLPSYVPITCGSSAFGTCTVTTTTSAGSSPANYDIIFGPDPIAGVGNGTNFTINLNTNGNTNSQANGAGGWGPGTDFDAVANVPEPAPVVLAGLGLLLFAGYRLLFWPLARKRFSKAAN